MWCFSVRPVILLVVATAPVCAQVLCPGVVGGLAVADVVVGDDGTVGRGRLPIDAQTRTGTDRRHRDLIGYTGHTRAQGAFTDTLPGHLGESGGSAQRRTVHVQPVRVGLPFMGCFSVGAIDGVHYVITGIVAIKRLDDFPITCNPRA